MSRLYLRLFLVLLVCEAAFGPLQAFAADEHGAHGDAHAVKLPMNWQVDLALFSVITFVVYCVVLKVAAWGPLQSALNDRERGIRQNIADAEASRLKSQSLLGDYEAKLAKVHEEVREILAGARREADHAKQEIVATAQREAEATKERAVAEIERSRDQALGELFDFVSNNVVSASEKVIGRSLTSADQDRLVNDALAQLNVRRN